jgi:hypothetical protein
MKIWRADLQLWVARHIYSLQLPDRHASIYDEHLPGHIT